MPEEKGMDAGDSLEQRLKLQGVQINDKHIEEMDAGDSLEQRLKAIKQRVNAMSPEERKTWEYNIGIREYRTPFGTIRYFEHPLWTMWPMRREELCQALSVS